MFPDWFSVMKWDRLNMLGYNRSSKSYEPEHIFYLSTEESDLDDTQCPLLQLVST